MVIGLERLTLAFHSAAEAGYDPQAAFSLLEHAQLLQVQYGAIIISFLGAVHWGLEVRIPTSFPRNSVHPRLARSGPSSAASKETPATSSASHPSSQAGDRSSSRATWRS